MVFRSKKNSNIIKEPPPELRKAYAKGKKEREEIVRYNTLKILALKNKTSKDVTSLKKGVVALKKKTAWIDKERAKLRREVADIKKEGHRIAKEKSDLELTYKLGIAPYKIHNRELNNESGSFPALSFKDQAIGILRDGDYKYGTFEVMQVFSRNKKIAIVKMLGRVVWLEGVPTDAFKPRGKYTFQLPLEFVGMITRKTVSHGKITLPRVQVYKVPTSEPRMIWL